MMWYHWLLIHSVLGMTVAIIIWLYQWWKGEDWLVKDLLAMVFLGGNFWIIIGTVVACIWIHETFLCGIDDILHINIKGKKQPSSKPESFNRNEIEMLKKRMGGPSEYRDHY